jgi:SAM-dependent methyltransferase
VSRRSENIYDYPLYFDLSFADETASEVEFLCQAFAKYARGKVRTVLEPGCGGGRLLVALAERGYVPTGLDLSPKAVEYSQQRLTRKQLLGRAYVGDMREIAAKRPYEAAICTFNTFRHLLTEADALAQLRSVAGVLRPGGVYILGLHLIPPDADPESHERWKVHQGKTCVACGLKVLSTDPRRRLERMRLTMRVFKGEMDLRLRTEFDLRCYTAGQLKRLLAKVPELELCDVFDFWYELDRPLKLTDELSDTVLVLRRK